MAVCDHENVTNRLPNKIPRFQINKFEKVFRSSSKEGNNRKDFTLNTLRFSSFGIYGREKELSQLRDSFDRVLQRDFEENENNAKCRRNREIVLLSGRSGCGKTALALELGKYVTKWGGMFSCGKVDFQRRSEPYAAFSEAFNELCDSILNLKKTDIAKFKSIKNSIRDAIGESHSHILSSIIPKLELILFHDENDFEDFDHDFQSGSLEKRNLSVTSQESVTPPNRTPKRNSVVASPSVPSSAMGPNSKQKFDFLIRTFIRAVCSASGEPQPLVLFIDDLHWADEASLDLMENLLTDEGCSSPLLFLGCYRDDEINHNEKNIISRTRKIKEKTECGRKNKGENNNAKDDKNGINVVNIKIGNLSVDTINSLLGDLLSSDAEKTQDLAQIVHKKTQGNVFFVIEFLKTIKSMGILEYKMGLMKWQWDIEKIKTMINVTENVAVLLKEKMDHVLNDEAKKVLFVAACLGSSFQVSTLILVVSRMNDDKGSMASVDNNDIVSSRVIRSLRLCFKENFLEQGGNEEDGNSPNRGDKRSGGTKSLSKSSPSSYRFVHDQIQQAAISLATNNHERALLQYRIGEILSSSSSYETEGDKNTNDLDKNLFTAVNLLNNVVGCIAADDNKNKGKILLRLTRLNLQAGKKAMESSAFHLATTYLTTGIDFFRGHVSEDEESCHKLSFDLYHTAARAEYCNGNTAKTHEYLGVVLNRENIPLEEKLPPYFTFLEALFVQEKHMENVNKSLRVLSDLGIKFPKWNLKFNIIKELLKTKSLLKGKRTESLLDLPLLEDDKKILALKIMDNMGTSAYVLKSPVFALTIFKMIQWSVRFGVSSVTPAAFVFYGIILCGIGDIRGGYDFGKLAVGMAARVTDKSKQSLVMFLFNANIGHWREPPPSSALFMQGYEIGMKTGDVKSAMFNITTIIIWCLNRGLNLTTLERRIRRTLGEVDRYNQEHSHTYLVLMLQMVLNLLGKSNDPTLLTGEVMDQEQMVSHLEDVGLVRQLGTLKMFRINLEFYFGNYERAWECVKDAKDFEKKCLSSPFLWRKLLFQGLTAFSLARCKRTACQKRYYKKCALRILKRVEKWVSLGNVICVHVLHLFRAEAAALDGKVDEACEKFNSSILVSTRAGFVHDKALANERFGEFFLDRNDYNQASFYLQKAHQTYNDWGAKGKVDQLHEKYSSLITS